MSFDRLDIERDALLRRDILRIADSGKAAGGVRGRLMMTVLDGLEDDHHLMGLCVDLISAGLLLAKDLRYRTTERRTLDNTVYEVTAQGTAALAGTVRHPLVADDRI